MISRGTIASVLGAAGVAGALIGIFAAETHGPTVGGAPFAPVTPSSEVTTGPAPVATDRPKTGSATPPTSVPRSFVSFNPERKKATVITTSDPVPPAVLDPVIESPATSGPPTGSHGGPTPWNGPPSSPEPTKPPTQN